MKKHNSTASRMEATQETSSTRKYRRGQTENLPSVCPILPASAQGTLNMIPYGGGGVLVLHADVVLSA